MLEIRTITFPKQIVIAQEDYRKNEESQIFVDVSLNIEYSKTTDVFHANMGSKTNLTDSNNFPYEFDVQVYGSFSTLADTDPPLTEKQVTNVIFTILYGALRERLTELTSRAPWSDQLLQTLPIPTDIKIRMIDELTE